MVCQLRGYRSMDDINLIHGFGTLGRLERANADGLADRFASEAAEPNAGSPADLRARSTEKGPPGYDRAKTLNGRKRCSLTMPGDEF